MNDCERCIHKGICKYKEKFLQNKKEIENIFGKEVFWSIKCNYYKYDMITSINVDPALSWIDTSSSSECTAIKP